ncbi:S1 RNA-binding domain-containing protein [Paramaledivibacter caminithermalis]|jgi:S1 RNA binding domain protein|uniref:S1 RNA binding domain protein n=1 Tax=Paramaledivibacter caminithermalis (strain DSM 15212 / CIP 107654 / DViRD3) TaxID=1121301 RepID=A0A1M6QN72_PARC5|nr:S1 RNA-binding domain-containing protein [Paramaledivibacter caminithermalis]SHK21722.1 S1 RNA binding domain protein [Paramaledivibacter caminithermalis DSM 15212]
MPLEIGKVVDGTVTGITNFGAFIQLPDGNTGLCHISEIADEYVKNVKDYLKEQQIVKVKIIEMNGNGKVSLSIRKACDNKAIKQEKIEEPSKTEKRQVERRVNDRKPKYNKSNKIQGSFEDMLSKFLKDSDEKLKTMKKNANNRRGNGFNRNG